MSDGETKIYRCGQAVCLLLFLSAMVLTSCSPSQPAGVGASQNEPSQPEVAGPPPRSFHVVVVSGFESDPTAAQIEGNSLRGVGNSGMFQLAGDLREKGIDCSFYNWNGTQAGHVHDENAAGPKQIADDMVSLVGKSPGVDFVMIGHSWGGHSIMEVASMVESKDEVKIVKAFVIDPSSMMRGQRAQQLPSNIPAMDNFFTANTFCWGEWKDETRINNVSLADPKNGFSVNGRPNYAGMFDMKAHTASEWDQKIHARICEEVAIVVGVNE